MVLVLNLGVFYGYIMSDDERARARQIKDNIPRLANAVDLLLAFQEKARSAAVNQACDQAERDKAAHRIEAERAQREVEV